MQKVTCLSGVKRMKNQKHRSTARFGLTNPTGIVTAKEKIWTGSISGSNKDLLVSSKILERITDILQ